MRFRTMLPTSGVLTIVLTLVLTSVGSTQAFAAPVVVACGPRQHAVVHDTFVRGQAVTRVACVSSRYDPVAYRTHDARRFRSGHSRRSWAKSALIIGGGAGTGAGVGGIVRGKKGALIGAALGGGLASLYEGAHRR